MRLSMIALVLLIPALAAAELVVTVPERVEGTYRDDLDWPQYEWAFETRIHNASDRPLRITAFGTSVHDGDAWVTRGEPFSGQQFVEWYTDGDALDDGWLAPGRTAVDARNWYRDPHPMGPAVRWFYRAEDPEGREYESARYVDFIPVEVPGAAWPSTYREERVRLRLEITDAQGEGVPGAFVHLGREHGGGAFVAGPVGANRAIEVVRPSLSILRVRAPGLLPVSIPLLIGEDTGDVTLRIALVAPDAEGAPSFEASDPIVQAALELGPRVRRMQREIMSDYAVYRKEHPGEQDFVAEHPALHETLVNAIHDTSRPAIARYAAYLSHGWTPRFAEEDQARIAALLPPDAHEWGMAAMYATNAANRATDRDAFIEGLSHHRDPTVRARALGYLGSVAQRENDAVRLAAIVERLRSAEFDGIDEAANHLELLTKVAKLRVGAPLPAFDLPTLDGEDRVTDRDPAGRFTFLQFWATWCGPCMAEMEEVHDAFDEVAGDRLRFVSMSLDFDRDAIATMRENQWPMPWTHLYWQDDPEYEDRFGVTSIPQFYLIDPEGLIVADSKTLRGEGLGARLEAAMEAARSEQ